MKRSTERILTTHVGSLIRPPDLREMIRARESGNPYDHEALAARVRSAVAEAVRQQVECGIDIVSDGEQGKLGFNTYTNQRLGGSSRERCGRESIPDRGEETWTSSQSFMTSICKPSLSQPRLRYAPTRSPTSGRRLTRTYRTSRKSSRAHG